MEAPSGLTIKVDDVTLSSTRTLKGDPRSLGQVSTERKRKQTAVPCEIERSPESPGLGLGSRL